MNLNPVDWNNAQSLLVKLVQALSPLTVRTVSSSFFLNRRFIIPQSYSNEELQSRSSVRILSKLHAVQKQMDEWIAEPVSVDELEAKKIVKSRAKEKLGLALETPKREASSPKPVIPPERTLSPEDPVPLIRQAKELIHQVQEAIVQLSKSTFIQEPKQEPLIQTLKQLKPKLDEIIKTVIKSKEQPIEKETSFRHAVPPSPREEIIQKLNEPPREKPLRAPKEEPVLSSKPQQLSTKAEPEQKEDLTPEKPLKKQALSEKEETINFVLTKKSKGKDAIPTLFHAAKTEKGETPLKMDPKSVTLPGVPMVFESKQLSQNRKKKKRKGFWFNKEAEEDSSK